MKRSKIINSIIKNGKRFINLEVFRGDNHNYKQYGPGGYDYNPSIDNEAIVDYVNGNPADGAVIAYRDIITKISASGEVRIYSTSADGTSIESTIHLKNDGTIEINGNADFAVRYNELQTAFDQLKDDFDTLVSTYNAHTHIVTTPDTINGTASATTNTGSPSTADITPAKVDTVKLP